MKNRLYLVCGVLLVAAFGALVWWQHQARSKGRVPRIAAGVTHLVVIKSDGTLWAMGRNTFTVAGTNVITGAVGDGTTTDRRRLVQISKDKDWAEVAAGEFFSLALKTDGSLWGWGLNNGGQLGDGTGQNHNRPVKLSKDHDWVGIAAGATHSLGLKADGSLWAWGWNDEGQLGLSPVADRRSGGWAWSPIRSLLGNTNTQNTPTRVGSGSDWKEVAAGNGYTLALKTNGSLWRWGAGAASLDVERSIQTDPAPDWRRTTSGTLALAKDWMRIASGTFAAAKDWMQIAAGEFAPAALKTDGSLWAWFTLSASAMFPGPSPGKVGDGHDWTAVKVGSHSALALKSDGSLWAWGLNTRGELGDGTTNLARAPVRIGSANNWVSIVAGSDYSAACGADGSLWMWGQRLVPGESKAMAWLRQLVTRWKLPIKLPPPHTMDLLPVKIADLGRWEPKPQLGDAVRQQAEASAKAGSRPSS